MPTALETGGWLACCGGREPSACHAQCLPWLAALACTLHPALSAVTCAAYTPPHHHHLSAWLPCRLPHLPYSTAAPGPSSSAAGAGGDLDAEYEEVAHPSRPLHWFGSLVAPSLRDAEGHFSRALELVVQAANAQAELRRGLERQLAAAGGGRAAAAGGDAAT